MFRLQILFTLCAASTFGANIPNNQRGLVPHLDDRIVGGADTTIDRFPYQVSVKHYGNHRCGGSICKSNLIVTAASCANALTLNHTTIAAGTTYRNEGGVQHSISDIIIHDDFDPWEYINDIALVILKDHLIFTDVIQPLDLASVGEILRPETRGYISGWGATTEGGFFVNVLQYVPVTIVGNKECAKIYEDKIPIKAAMLCAGEPLGGKAACQGDVGAPLIVENKLRGIYSYSTGCGEAGFPGVFANISFLRRWINKQISAINK